MGEVGDVVNRQDEGSRHAQWCSVSRREEHISARGANRAGQGERLPEGATRTGRNLDRRGPRHASQGLVRDQRPLVSPCVIAA